MQSHELTRRIGWGAALLLLPALAYAHVGSGYSGGMAQGFLHPWMGIDHMAAMLAVGLWAAQRGGRAIWVVPVSFMTVMLLGGAIGMAGVALPWVEPGIVASVLVLGLLVAASVRLPLLASGGLVGLFAVFHGHAHGTEMPAMASGLAYGIGFVIATAALHGCGVGLGHLARRWASPRIAQYAGALIAAFGLYLGFA
ncbi:HupE/UreJ family protein [uncultured Halomonas sp.]|uniref:HupE/UreJ family protein n=1 Tax=uncultured Halomonas sp. TaxID=173971 RepID=UPI002617AFF2|nr:HupE/UreJ family protein [uncultured Halomonas sp.]